MTLGETRASRDTWHVAAHGLAAHIRAGRIEVRAIREGERTVIEIVDDGPGVTAGDIKDGVGLGNTRARLQEMFGSRHAFDVTNAPGGGTLVRVSLPWQIESTQGAQRFTPPDAAAD